MWLINGTLEGNALSAHDVWSSDDGVHWRQAAVAPAFGERFAHGSVVFDDRLWVVGGRHTHHEYAGPQNDVWYSYTSAVGLHASPDANPNRNAHSDTDARPGGSAGVCAG